MQIKIRIIDVTPETVAGKTQYTKLVVSYRDVNEDKVKATNVMSFGDKAVFTTLSNAVKGDEFTVTLEKNDKGYWQWIGIEKGISKAEAPADAAKPAAKAGWQPNPNSETPDERAKKQVYIVRQSSLATAVASFGDIVNSFTAKDIIDRARDFEEYVFEQGLEEDIS